MISSISHHIVTSPPPATQCRMRLVWGRRCKAPVDGGHMLAFPHRCLPITQEGRIWWKSLPIQPGDWDHAMCPVMQTVLPKDRTLPWLKHSGSSLPAALRDAPRVTSMEQRSRLGHSGRNLTQATGQGWLHVARSM